MKITPEVARKYRHQWGDNPIGDDIFMAGVDALETVAGMREEWGCHWEDVGVGPWHEDRERAMFDLSMGYPFFVEKGKPRPKGRIVRRYVTAPEVIDGD